jgi:hypothetical protein
MVSMPISKAVGRGGSNIKKDVRYVQALLNFWRQDNGRVQIKVDGLVGPQTIGAIEDFQRAKTGIVDGRVDPNGPSIKALEAAIESYARQLKAYSVLALVLSWDPRLEYPVLNSSLMQSMLPSILPGQRG